MNKLTKDEILGFIREMSHSQGFYGRLLTEIYENPDILDTLEAQGFTDILDLIMFIEC